MRFDVPDDKIFTHEMVMPIRWGDMDAMGHVNNTNYFRYMEVARLDWLFRVADIQAPGGLGPVIVNAFCNFVLQLAYPGDVLVKHYVAQPGRSSFDTYLVVERTDQPGVVYANGGATTVWVDYQKKTSVPLPEGVRRFFGPASG